MKIHEILCEDEILDEIKSPSLKEVIRALRRKGWTKVEGGSHEKWYPPAGVSTTDDRPYFAIPRTHCNPQTLKQIIKSAGLTPDDF